MRVFACRSRSLSIHSPVHDGQCGSRHSGRPALIVDVGKSAESSMDLPGINLDVRLMQEVAERVGFTEIRTLTDADVTYPLVAVARALNFTEVELALDRGRKGPPWSRTS